MSDNWGGAYHGIGGIISWNETRTREISWNGDENFMEYLEGHGDDAVAAGEGADEFVGDSVAESQERRHDSDRAQDVRHAVPLPVHRGMRRCSQMTSDASEVVSRSIVEQRGR